MNVERWVASRRPVWQKLEDLLKRIDKAGLSRLDRDELQDLGRLYRSTSSDLSRARALNLGSDIVSYLNNLAVKAHNQVYQSKKNRWLDFFNFFYATFPQMVRNNFAYVAVAFLVCVAPALLCYDCTRHDLQFARMDVVHGQPLVSDDLWDMIEQHKMWTDQLQDASPAWSSVIAANNIRVCILSFALGVTAGIGTLVILFFNGMSVGTVFGVCQHYGLFHNLLLFIVGHGSLELPSIFISGGAGLLLGRGILFPGRLKRSDSFKQAAKTALGLFGGVVPLLLIAGCIEAFVSPRTDLSAATKVTVGAAAFLCLCFYLFVPRDPLGRPADAQR
jgi:uncharacterized membrane protein SpoIIM required for sporulation